MQLIDQERSKIDAESKRLAEKQSKMIAAAAKKEAKRQAFAEQCSGANGKVKSSPDSKNEKFAKKVAKMRELADRCSMSSKGFVSR